MRTAVQVADETRAKREKVAALLQGKLNAEGQYDLNAEQLGEVKALNMELNDLATEQKSIKDYADEQAGLAQLDMETKGFMSEHSAKGTMPFRQTDDRKDALVKTIGEILTESKSFKEKEYLNRRLSMEFGEAEYKATITTANGLAPVNNRTSIVIPSAQRRPVVADLIPQSNTTDSIIRYARETTYTSQAGMVAEGAAKLQSQIGYTVIDSPVGKAAHSFKVTTEQLDDVPGFQQRINLSGALMLQQAQETQIISGNGAPPQIYGFLNTVGILTQARGTDTNEDAILRGKDDVLFEGRATPSGVIVNPANYETMRLRKSTTNEYIFGPPSAETNIPRIWGMDMIVTDAMTANTALLGDFTAYSHISNRQGITMSIGHENDDFTKNLVTIIMELRFSLEIYRPAAFLQVTGLN